MKRSFRFLPCGALVLVLTMGIARAQTDSAGRRKPAKPTETDWAKTVEKAHRHPRIMLRRAAARAVADAGDAAVGAVADYEQKHGRSAISLELVTGYGRSKADGPKTMALLEDWAKDRTFYWRSQAMEAIANRRLPRYRSLFQAHLDDVAYLTRIQAGRGLCLLDVDRDKVLALLRDEDPRVRLRVAVCLVEEKDDRGLPALVEALRQDAKFLDNPWGQLGARTAFHALRKVAGDEFGYRVGVDAGANAAAIDRFAKFARQRLGDKWADPVPAYRETAEYVGGLEIRSCRNGDLFLRFAADRRVVFGLEGRAACAIAKATWEKLITELPGRGDAIRGKVVCDYARLMCNNPTLDQKFAPGGMPATTGKWLEALAAALEKNGRADLGKQITERLDQFVAQQSPR